MKENSIEEDIKIVESIIEEYENCSIPEIDMQVNVTFREKENDALNHILSDYKRVLKENEDLKSKNKTLEELLQGNLYELYKYYKELLGTYQGNCISIQEIKGKIEELEIEILECTYDDDDIEEYKRDIDKNKIELLKEKRTLQELIEGRE